MRLSHLTYPDSVAAPPRRLVQAFRRHCLDNAELCDRCFAQIRAIGEVQEKRTDLFTHELNAYYERTEHGSQEFTSFDPPTDRYGTCFCENCGAASDSNCRTDDHSLDTLQTHAKRCLRYIRRTTRFEIDAERAGRTLAALKTIPDNGGLDTEILAVTVACGLTDPRTPGPTRTRGDA